MHVFAILQGSQVPIIMTDLPVNLAATPPAVVWAGRRNLERGESMDRQQNTGRWLFKTSGFCTLLGVALLSVTFATRDSQASIFKFGRCGQGCDGRPSTEGEITGDVGGSWHWLRSPEEEKRVVIGLYNRYCIRCHGVDGRGIWDIPDVPDFTNSRWQMFRSDGQLARAILEGRGACMPPFRGTLTIEEAWAMARHLRTFVPGTEISRPDFSQPKKTPEMSAPTK
jgi:cbb3-type cytochrome c oxidase subunit III